MTTRFDTGELQATDQWQHVGQPDTSRSKHAAGVIWITGFSGAGKTTVGRLVERRLRGLGANSVFLDGDHLRSIFGEHWGYDRESRVDLARVYFRLCSHLASQGLTVIISAVALYDEVSDWVKANVPSAVQVYLRVPEDERRRRDSTTKMLYERIGDVSRLYDYPRSPALVLDNYGAATPDMVADEVVKFFWTRVGTKHVDHGRTEHWSNYYRSFPTSMEPSPFAMMVAKQLKPPSRLLEVGCGNGRDASHFAREGHSVVGLDTSSAAIDLCRQTYNELPIEFFNLPIAALESRGAGPFDSVYSRFCLHAMTEPEEIELLGTARRILRPDGLLFIECRSINDPLARMGEVISPTERIHGHYRRFIILEELVERVEMADLSVDSVLESRGLAVFGDEDPAVIRLVARRKAG